MNCNLLTVKETVKEQQVFVYSYMKEFCNNSLIYAKTALTHPSFVFWGL